MPVVEVSCPGCGAKLKAPDNMIGKKAKCKKCGKTFRIPGSAPAADSTASEGVALSVVNMAVPPLPEDEATEVMMAEPVAGDEMTLPLPAAPAAAPVPDVSTLPSADAFDFGKPAARPAFGAAKAAAPAPAAKPAPVAPKPAASVAKPAAPAPAPAPVAAKAVPLPPAPLPPAPAKPAKPRDEDLQQTLALPPAPAAPVAAKAKPAPAPAAEENAPVADNPFAFSSTPATGEKPGKPRRREEDDEEDERPRKKRRNEAEEDEDEKPAKAKRRRDDEGEEEKVRKKRQKDEDDEEKPARAKSAEPYNPFADFPSEPAEPTKSKNRDDEDDKPTRSKRRDEGDEGDEGDGKPRKKRKDKDEGEPEDDKPRYRRPEEKGGAGKMILITAVVGLFALGLGITAVIVYIKNNKKEPEQTKEEKKEEPPPATPGVPGVPGVPPDPKPKDPELTKPKDKNPDPKPKDPDPKPKDKNPDPGPAPTRDTIALPKLKGFTVGTLAPKPEEADRPRAGMVLDVPFGQVRRIYPPHNTKAGDTFVLIQTSAGIGGKGERYALDSYGPSGNRVATARIEYDGDGLTTPIADVHTSATGSFFLSATGGKLHIWSLADKSKIADGVSPYTDKPEHAKAGLAAAFFAANPKFVVTVSTAGAVLLFDYAAGKAVSEFVPPHGTPGKVALGQSIAKADGNASVVVAVAGILYQVKASPGLDVLRQYDLGGDVGRSIALAVSGTPGRLMYVFESAPDKTGKKDKAVLCMPLKGAKHIIHPLPATIGDPKGAVWANNTAGGLILDRGVVWFDDDEDKFIPLFMTVPPATGLYFGSEQYFWYVVAHPREATKSVLVALSVPFDDQMDYEKNYGRGQPLKVARIDGTGLSK